MKLWHLLLAMALLILVGCQEKSYYSQFANPDLIYEWDFNSSMKDFGGNTYNSTYFQLRKYGVIEEILSLRIPYSVQYKHEEGHIYQHRLLNISNFDKFISYRCKVLNLTDCETVKEDSFRQYVISVSEGSADYYSMNYFNNSLSIKYLRHLESIKQDRKGAGKQHYDGYVFVNESMASGDYADLKYFIQDIGQESQYREFQKFLNR